MCVCVCACVAEIYVHVSLVFQFPSEYKTRVGMRTHTHTHKTSVLMNIGGAERAHVAQIFSPLLARKSSGYARILLVFFCPKMAI